MHEKMWVAPKIIIGPGATGDYYYQRTSVENDIIDEIMKGNNVLIAAPRRIGKTSIMRSLEEMNIEGNYLVFKNIQGLASEEGFYKTVFELLLNSLDQLQKGKKQVTNYFKRIGISEISTNGIKLISRNLNYLEEIYTVVELLNKNENRIVLLIDELPELLHNLYKSNRKEKAISILGNLRNWRQDKRFEKLRFVIAGSIGIHHVVSKIRDRVSDINDFKSIECPAIPSEEFHDYVVWATLESSISFDENSIKYLGNKINYFVPYFINLMIDAIYRIAREKQINIIDEGIIEEAYLKIIKNQDYFSDWNKRLRDYHDSKEYEFVNKILAIISHKDSISIHEIYDVAVNKQVDQNYSELLYNLVKDGYLIKTNQKYTFLSPFLKEFWKTSNPIIK